KKKQVALDKVQTELKKREEDFIKLEKKLSDKEKNERRKEFQAELMILREKLQRFQDDLRTLQKKLVGRLDKDIKAAINKVGKKEKCEIILEKQSVYMGGRDITENVIEFLNK
ncbi:OmpH family outer membrane protein, partial [bacterium]|nr:OmpH family outer membrane protein [bacterium]